ncbi:hypothetical protein MBBAR_1c02270 [Methanobrevibacter arboriphilus JCM 13429 = DSM 1125]|uniref:Uncharacterized protein n=1 Tax=Methanobrevibacter arboriphilus JCM 13429 = DSM 1125 TaxID=1300164 RepID=A0A1V6N582_METAZ|nr:hypothetical protein [Methanobrevibacter arboriphilus]OQD59819.1 hypothetical protein MBBAR_1c02270 [Methanobrevibacter arboriphilus JCM 13429 = DSM 1125]
MVIIGIPVGFIAAFTELSLVVVLVFLCEFVLIGFGVGGFGGIGSIIRVTVPVVLLGRYSSSPSNETLKSNIIF